MPNSHVRNESSMGRQISIIHTPTSVCKLRHFSAHTREMIGRQTDRQTDRYVDRLQKREIGVYIMYPPRYHSLYTDKSKYNILYMLLAVYQTKNISINLHL